MMTYHIKPVGKLKKGMKFKQAEDGPVYIITRSGYGTGKYVVVDFENTDPADGNTYCLPKDREVRVIC